MRLEREMTSLSWIPSEAVAGAMKMPFELGVVHYDPPPPERVDDLAGLCADDRFRFANHLRGWIEVGDGGAITAAGHSGRGLMGHTEMRAGRMTHTFEAFALPIIQHEPQLDRDRARFVQTFGGCTGAPSPRRVKRPPYVQWRAPLVWTTLALVIHADGRVEHEMEGASEFPRHWVYGPDGSLAAKSGLTDFKGWYRSSFGRHSPWGGEDTAAMVAAAETALERRLSETIMRSGEQPERRAVKPGTAIAIQGTPGEEIFLLLDGIVRVDVDGEPLAEMGPGAVFGERAMLEGGMRTADNVAVTACRLAVARKGQIDPAVLRELAEGHRREETARTRS